MDSVGFAGFIPDPPRAGKPKETLILEYEYREDDLWILK
jgi:hypothetical protein